MRYGRVENPRRHQEVTRSDSYYSGSGVGEYTSDSHEPGDDDNSPARDDDDDDEVSTTRDARLSGACADSADECVENIGGDDERSDDDDSSSLMLPDDSEDELLDERTMAVVRTGVGAVTVESRSI